MIYFVKESIIYEEIIGKKIDDIKNGSFKNLI